MHKDCSIHYELTQTLFEDSETQIFDYTGKLLTIDQKHHLHYSFTQDDITTDVLMEITNKSISVRQTGGIISNVTYLPGQHTNMIYQTPTGEFSMNCTTNSYHLKACEEYLNITLSYDLFSGNDLLSTNLLKIKIIFQK